MDKNNLITIQEFCRRNPVFNQRLVYRAAHYTEKTGIVESGALCRMTPRGRWFVDEEKMFAFMRSYSRKWTRSQPDPDGEPANTRPTWAKA